MLTCYDDSRFFSDFEDRKMKKVVLALIAAAAGFAGMSSAFAYDHHPVCHKGTRASSLGEALPLSSDEPSV
ncbi:exported hypothetical protein [Paraburkholderia piptadeniae]|uniref:Uncharacterized protein n=1 Tax=Paraburkholderia piptadeniae TaxID=1701573 RepID=A0A1N7S7E7_9BURK|nr:hypothetical protein [Paraburkholderia piptadeniae]SIT43358.1 exported hypothetical protein [Paraburkholderia piptadeniae]